MKSIAGLLALMCLSIFVHAQTSCTTAIPVPYPPTNGSPFTGPVAAVFSAACNPIPNPTPTHIDTSPSLCSTGACTQEVWFYISPGAAGTQQNLQIRLTPNFNDNIKVVLLYSESIDGSDAVNPECGWVNSISTIFTERGSMCIANSIAGTNYDFMPEGLDGSGFFFLLIQREMGTGGSISVQLRKQSLNPTCSPPANDLCTNAQNMTTPTMGGLGIDDAYAGGGSGTWNDAISGTTRCATKQRLNSPECGGTQTEDMYWLQNATTFFQCLSDNSLGDGASPFSPLDDCVNNLDNTVYFSFTCPMSALDWYLHIGQLTCGWGVDEISVMLATNLNCSDASLTSVQSCSNALVTGSYPSPDLTMGPFTLLGGTTYAIIVDGARSSQCDFQMILNRLSIMNPVLPMRFGAVEAWNSGASHHLQWNMEVGSEEVDYYLVERSLNGIDYQTISQSIPTIQNHFQESNPLQGLSYYRIVAVDQNGQYVYSESRQLSHLLESSQMHLISADHRQLLIELELAQSGPVSLSLLDLNGKQIMQKPLNLPAGSHQIQLQSGKLSAGMYVLVLDQESGPLYRRFLVN